MISFSLIILSRTNSEAIFQMNKECMTTFIESANHANESYEIILIESNKEAKYDYDLSNLKIIMPEATFNFHKFLNIGVVNASGNYYILSNNDVVFEVEWLKEIMQVAKNNTSITSFSPYDPKANKLPIKTIKTNDFILGYKIQKHLTGWCIVTHKSVFEKIKKLDERFSFYYADNDYAMQLQKYNIKHALVPKAIVHHLESVSSNSLPKLAKPKTLPKKTPKYIIRENWTWVLNNPKMIDGLIIFHNKWGNRKMIKLKLLITKQLSKIGLGFFNKYILTNS